MTEYQILFWHDIPVQVRARRGEERAGHPLPQRFQVAVDNAAMAVGLIGDDDYTDLFRWSEPEEREGSPADVAAAVAAELEARYPDVNWQKTAKSLGKKLHESS